jgi:hypothetical protein
MTPTVTETCAGCQRPTGQCICVLVEGVSGPVVPEGSVALVSVAPPFTPEQVASLNAYQASGAFHPYTCGNDDCHGVKGQHASLVARADGWHCPACDYTQEWAHASTAGGSWRQFEGIAVTVDGGPPVKGEIGSIPS